MEPQNRLVKVRKCNKCHYFTKSDPLMKIHLKRHKSKQELFSCGEQLEEYRCDECSYRTDLTGSFIRHVKIHCEKGEATNLTRRIRNWRIYRKIHCCKQCPYFTTSLILLHNHTKHHKSPQTLFDCEQSTIEEFFCTKCKFSTHYLRDLIRHGKSQHTIKWKECQHCDYKTKSTGQLKKHVLRKHRDPLNTEWHECDQCEYRSVILQDFKAHYRKKHQPDSKVAEANLRRRNRRLSKKKGLSPVIKWHECEHCDFKTQYAYTLKMHVKCKHGESKWHQCEHCEFRTANKKSLKNHAKNKHTPESELKWYECEQCDFRSIYKPRVNCHVKTVHAADGCKWYRCDQCAYKGTCQSNLRRHIKRLHQVRKI